nr:MAG TPA: DNA polymerase II small subunit [Caudoviricetes sp.]
MNLSYDEIADIINREFREDESQYRTESAYRKSYSQAKRFYEAGVFNNLNEDNYLKELRTLKDAVYKEKRKLYDQRREYNKILTSDARSEHIMDELVLAADRMNNTSPLIFSDTWFSKNTQKQALLLWADWHYGMVTDNIWNKYDTDICRARVKMLVERVKDFIQLNGVDVLNIVMLGDASHGGIHSTCRVKSEEDVCDQLMNVSEIMAGAINDLSSIVNQVFVYSCYGNHMRTIQDKKDSIHSDNMEKVIPWWIRQRLQNNSKVEIIESEYKEFTKVRIFDKNIVAIHGDLEKNFKDIGVTVNTLFSRKFGETIDYTVSADKHHLEEFERFDIESILVRSLCGTDDYANNGRLYSRPGQTLMIFNDVYGRESTYNIPLDK